MSETGCGHGWVFRLPGGFKARCGGPPMCEHCQRDVHKLAAQVVQRPAWQAYEAELQACFDRAREAT